MREGGRCREQREGLGQKGREEGQRVRGRLVEVRSMACFAVKYHVIWHVLL